MIRNKVKFFVKELNSLLLIEDILNLNAIKFILVNWSVLEISVLLQISTVFIRIIVRKLMKNLLTLYLLVTLRSYFKICFIVNLLALHFYVQDDSFGYKIF